MCFPLEDVSATTNYRAVAEMLIGQYDFCLLPKYLKLLSVPPLSGCPDSLAHGSAASTSLPLVCLLTRGFSWIPSWLNPLSVRVGWFPQRSSSFVGCFALVSVTMWLLWFIFITAVLVMCQKRNKKRPSSFLNMLLKIPAKDTSGILSYKYVGTTELPPQIKAWCVLPPSACTLSFIETICMHQKFT